MWLTLTGWGDPTIRNKRTLSVIIDDRKKMAEMWNYFSNRHSPREKEPAWAGSSGLDLGVFGLHHTGRPAGKHVAVSGRCGI